MVRYSSFAAVACVFALFTPVESTADDSNVVDFAVNLLDEESLSLDLGDIPISGGRQGKIQVLSGEQDVDVLIGLYNRSSSCQ